MVGGAVGNFVGELVLGLVVRILTGRCVCLVEGLVGGLFKGLVGTLGVPKGGAFKSWDGVLVMFTGGLRGLGRSKGFNGALVGASAEGLFESGTGLLVVFSGGVGGLVTSKGPDWSICRGRRFGWRTCANLDWSVSLPFL